MSKSGNNFSQYYLLRGGVTPMVSTGDYAQMYGLDVGDAASATVARWNAAVGMAVYSRAEFMEALPSQAIRFQAIPTTKINNNKMLEPQSKKNFERFHLQK